MSGPRLVVAIVRGRDLGRNLIAQHVDQHHHIGRLDDLRPANPAPPEDDLAGKGARRNVGRDDVLKPKETGELFVKKRLGIERVDQSVRNQLPAMEFASCQPQPLAQSVPLHWVKVLEYRRELEGALEIPARSDV